jgi:hypothetical protein
MGTVVKTFTFDADAEGLTDRGTTGNLTFAWATDAAVKFTTTKKNLSAVVEGGWGAATGVTWETWGVPAGATVTAVQCTAWKKKVVTNTYLTSHSATIQVLSTTTTTHSAGNLISTGAWSTSTDASYQDGAAGSSRAVDATYQPSTTVVRLDIEYTVTTGSSTSAIDTRFDTIQLTITYTPLAYVFPALTLAP